MVKTYSELYLNARNAFLKSEEDAQSASLLARDLLCFATGKRREDVLRDQNLYASEEICEAMAGYVERVLKGEPLAYILGEWEFYGLPMHVNEHVLIPRDDTCAVTELAISNGLFLDPDPRILDLCTGSGCIGIAVASRLKDARVTLADISRDALAVAKKNVSNLKLSGRVSCVHVDALKEAPAFLGKFDMIISNPPYITKTEMEELPGSVRNYEPHLALFGGDDGLDFYRSIAANYRSALKPGGYLLFEFGMGQGDDVCRILAENGFTILERTKDFNDRERAVLAQYGRKKDHDGDEEDEL